MQREHRIIEKFEAAQRKVKSAQESFDIARVNYEKLQAAWRAGLDSGPGTKTFDFWEEAYIGREAGLDGANADLAEAKVDYDKVMAEQEARNQAHNEARARELREEADAQAAKRAARSDLPPRTNGATQNNAAAKTPQPILHVHFTDPDEVERRNQERRDRRNGNP